MNGVVNYRTVGDLSRDLLGLAERLPPDVDLVVGVPRSGMLAATILALHLDCALSDVATLASGEAYLGGLRTRGTDPVRPRHAVVIDDCVGSGRAMREARARLRRVGADMRISFAAAYVSNSEKSDVDYYHSVVPFPRAFEWNVMHHGELRNCCMDIDGVLCRDPTDLENDDADRYHDFLANASPRLLPSRRIGWLVTSRLEKYRAETERWLDRHGITYDHLVMHPAQTAEHRRTKGDHARRKAQAYKDSGAWLFIESEPAQAIEIARLSGRSVFCTDTREMYHPGAISALLARRRSLSVRLLNRTLKRIRLVAATVRWRR
jgi:orotate phosphoribosyltransferase